MDDNIILNPAKAGVVLATLVMSASAIAPFIVAFLAIQAVAPDMVVVSFVVPVLVFFLYIFCAQGFVGRMWEWKPRSWRE
ncbi:MAG: hypothetical protein Q4Q62_01305 [Thermoplasmata archaeon]|nr:hypothetical protein [Thermoplasmata archaeon]